MKRLVLLFICVFIYSINYSQVIIQGKVKNFNPSQVDSSSGINFRIDIKYFNIKSNLTKNQSTLTNKNGEYKISIEEDSIESIFLSCNNQVFYLNVLDNNNQIIDFDLDLGYNYFNNSTKLSAGDHLKLASKHFYTGSALTIIGAGITTFGLMSQLGTITTDKYVIDPFVIIGAAVTISGTILVIESHSHIYKAGVILNRNGVGLNVKF